MAPRDDLNWHSFGARTAATAVLVLVLVLVLAARAFADVSAPPVSAAEGCRVEFEDGIRQYWIELGAREAHACWPRRKFVTPRRTDLRRLEAALPGALAQLAAGDGADARNAAGLLQLLPCETRIYAQQADGRIDLFGTHPSGAEERCPAGWKTSDDNPWWRVTYDPRTGAFTRFELAHYADHM